MILVCLASSSSSSFLRQAVSTTTTMQTEGVHGVCAPPPSLRACVPCVPAPTLVAFVVSRRSPVMRPTRPLPRVHHRSPVVPRRAASCRVVVRRRHHRCSSTTSRCPRRDHAASFTQKYVPSTTNTLPAPRSTGDRTSSFSTRYPVSAVKMKVSALHTGAVRDTGSLDKR